MFHVGDLRFYLSKLSIQPLMFEQIQRFIDPDLLEELYRYTAVFLILDISRSFQRFLRVFRMFDDRFFDL